MKITRKDNVITVCFDVAADWQQWIMLRSDTHHDSVHCDRKLETAHLKKALERNALIFDGGDLADAMQGRYDPRRSYKDIRMEYLVGVENRDAYYDNVTKEAIAYYEPYAQNIVMMARGNHETSVIKNASHDMTGALVSGLNNKTGSNIIPGNYGGWVRFLFKRGGVYQASLRMKYFHGAGGEAPVTRGVIQTNRQAVYNPDADIVWNGHSHNEYILNIKRERMSGKGEIYFDLCTFVRTPGYKNDYEDGSSGWEVERGGVPKPLGCAWVRFGWDGNRKRPTREVFSEVE